jgi:hypothetical protein
MFTQLFSTHYQPSQSVFSTEAAVRADIWADKRPNNLQEGIGVA